MEITIKQKMTARDDERARPCGCWPRRARVERDRGQPRDWRTPPSRQGTDREQSERTLPVWHCVEWQIGRGRTASAAAIPSQVNRFKWFRPAIRSLPCMQKACRLQRRKGRYSLEGSPVTIPIATVRQECSVGTYRPRNGTMDEGKSMVHLVVKFHQVVTISGISPFGLSECADS